MSYSNTSSTPTATAGRLLDAAEAIFADVGFSGATTAAIAERAGVTKALVHYYYGTKESLHRAVMERYEDRLGEPMLAGLDAEHPVEAIIAAVRHYCAFLAGHPRYVRLCLFNALEGSRTLADTAMFSKLVEVTTAALHRGMDQGHIRRIDPEHVIVIIESLCRHFFDHENALSELWDDFDRERFVRQHTEHVVRVIEQTLTRAS